MSWAKTTAAWIMFSTYIVWRFCALLVVGLVGIHVAPTIFVAIVFLIEYLMVS